MLPTFPARQVYSITELTNQIRQNIETQFMNIWVEGEVSNFTLSSLGHAYFTLKDNECQLKVVIFKTKLRYLQFQPKNGQQLIMHGSLTVYEKRGEYQLLGDYYEPKGIGSLQLAFEELKNRLHQEGLFDQAHKKPIPFLCRTLGIITSPTGAALHDILNVAYRRFPNLQSIINPVPVQGKEAGGKIAQAIKELNDLPEIDVIILARGGGSLEDLWCFNEEIVARAIYGSAKPIVSAVGHEVDYTIADFVSDLRAPTPSAAAELVTKDKNQIKGYLNLLQDKLTTDTKQKITLLKQHVIQLQQTRTISAPQSAILNQYQQQLDESKQQIKNSISLFIKQRKETLQNDRHCMLLNHPLPKVKEYIAISQQLEQKLQQSVFTIINQQKNQLAELTAGLDALNPLQVLKRGYSICQKTANSELITDSNQVNLGDSVTITLHHGQLSCLVNKKHN